MMVPFRSPLQKLFPPLAENVLPAGTETPGRFLYPPFARATSWVRCRLAEVLFLPPFLLLVSPSPISFSPSIIYPKQPLLFAFCAIGMIRSPFPSQRIESRRPPKAFDHSPFQRSKKKGALPAGGPPPSFFFLNPLASRPTSFLLPRVPCP